MASPDGRPVFIREVPWCRTCGTNHEFSSWCDERVALDKHREAGEDLVGTRIDSFRNEAHYHSTVTLPSLSPSPQDNPVFVNQSGQYVNSEGEPLSEEDWDLKPDDG